MQKHRYFIVKDNVCSFNTEDKPAVGDIHGVEIKPHMWNITLPVSPAAYADMSPYITLPTNINEHSLECVEVPDILLASSLPLIQNGSFASTVLLAENITEINKIDITNDGITIDDSLQWHRLPKTMWDAMMILNIIKMAIYREDNTYAVEFVIPVEDEWDVNSERVIKLFLPATKEVTVIRMSETVKLSGLSIANICIGLAKLRMIGLPYSI